MPQLSVCTAFIIIIIFCIFTAALSCVYSFYFIITAALCVLINELAVPGSQGRGFAAWLARHAASHFAATRGSFADIVCRGHTPSRVRMYHD